MNKILYFVCCRSSSPAFCVTREEKCPTLSPLASLWISQQVTQIPPTPPLAEFCVPCVPSGTGGTLLSQPSHKTTQAPWLPPESPVWPVSIPGGERPAPARSGAGLGHTGPSLAERKENSPTRKTTASVTGEYASFRLPTRRMVSQKPEVVKGVKKEQVKGPGSPTGVPCRVTSPGRAGR